MSTWQSKYLPTTLTEVVHVLRDAIVCALAVAARRLAYPAGADVPWGMGGMSGHAAAARSPWQRVARRHPRPATPRQSTPSDALHGVARRHPLHQPGPQTSGWGVENTSISPGKKRRETRLKKRNFQTDRHGPPHPTLPSASHAVILTTAHYRCKSICGHNVRSRIAHNMYELILIFP